VVKTVTPDERSGAIDGSSLTPTKHRLVVAIFLLFGAFIDIISVEGLNLIGLKWQENGKPDRVRYQKKKKR
jgi:hypothetical protein